ncbi:MAG: VOC family protein [Candidatus Nanopelagicales bacterium]
MTIQFQVTFDCLDPARLAEFWAAALGYQLDSSPPGFATWPEALAAWGVPESEWNSASAVVDPSGAGPRVFFQRVPERRSTKNRVHLDLRCSDVTAAPDVRREQALAAVPALVELGATRSHEVESLGSFWIVMHDPEGNEFCVT